MQSTFIRSVRILAACIGMTAGAAYGQGTFVPETVSDVPPDPEIERQSFKVAEGFEVNLWAADPLLAKPIQMNWDAQGRLWVASSSMYPQIQPGEAPKDKVVVLEDSDNDGKADKANVFADGLLIPTGVEPGDGGAYVANSTELIHLKDTDGDGKADERRVVLSGFGTEDTHHILHTFRWGNDGRLWMNQSIYIHSHVETPWGTKRLMGSGIWRFRPESFEFDVFARGMVNPWGHALDRFGQSFSTDGAGGEGIYYTFPGSAFQSAKSWDGISDMARIMHGMNPGSPKYCGLEIVTGRHLPDDWQNNAITNDFRANRVVRYQIVDEKGTFVSKQMPDVITSTDVAFRPIDVKMGPDGAIYIADWYNPIINHGEVDFRDKRRDKVHGRIWRITAKGRPLVEKPKLVGAPVADVLEQLKSPESWTRHQAKLVLRAVGAKEVLPALNAWVTKLDPKDSNIEHQRLEALWLYQTLDTPEPALLTALLKSNVPQVRAAATRIVPDWAGRLSNVMDLLASQIADEHPRVRLEAVRALARLQSLPAFELAMTALDRPMDAQIDYALWTTANEMQALWIPAFQAGTLKTPHAGYALQSLSSPQALAGLIQQLQGDRVWLASPDLIGTLGNAEQVAVLWKKAMDGSGDAATFLSAVRQAGKRNVKPANVEGSQLVTLLSRSDLPPAARREAMLLAGTWKSAEAKPELVKLATAAQTPAEVRKIAIEALTEYGPDSAETLRQLDAADRPFEVRVTGIAALATLDLKDAANRAASLLDSAPATADISSLISTFIQREGGGDALAAALEGKKVNPDAAKLAIRFISGSGRDNPALSERLREAGGIGAAANTLTPEQMAEMIKDVQTKGDAARGELVFRRSDTSCYQCHGIGGAGGQLAPDLRAIGASSPIDYLIDSLIEPNKAVKDGYEAVVVATKKGEVFSGIKVSQDDRQVILRDATHDRIAIDVASIRKERAGGSLMPAGLVDTLTRGELLDLVKFMTELGKPGPYGPDTALLVRRWSVLDKAAADRVARDPSVLQSAESAKALGWQQAYTLVSGDLPASALAITKGQNVAIARSEIDVTTDGRIALHLGDTKGLALWLDGKPVEVKPVTELALTRGVHALTFKIDLSHRDANKTLRVELRDVAGSGGHAQPVGGR